MSATADRLPFTGDDAADRYLVEEPLALLIGFALDQQVTVQKAFSGPHEIRRRLGHLDAARIAATTAADLDLVFRTPPAIHRFPSSMAAKVQALCAVIAEHYGNDASRIWREARDGRDLRDRLAGLPGFGAMKVDGTLAILAQAARRQPARAGRGPARPPDPRRRRFARGARPRTRPASAPPRPRRARRKGPPGPEAAIRASASNMAGHRIRAS